MRNLKLGQKFIRPIDFQSDDFNRPYEFLVEVHELNFSFNSLYASIELIKLFILHFVSHSK